MSRFCDLFPCGKGWRIDVGEAPRGGSHPGPCWEVQHNNASSPMLATYFSVLLTLQRCQVRDIMERVSAEMVGEG